MATTKDTMTEVQQRLDGLIEQFVADSDPLFQRSYRHILCSTGKRLRPTLVYVTADIFSTPRETVDKFALAIELIHTATLIFDDLPGQDNADLRRGRKTLHILFSEAEAQMAGLALIFDAEQLIADVDSQNDLKGTLMRYANDSIGQRGLCLGQLMDLLTFNQGHEVPYDVKLLDTISKFKTGKAIEISLVSSAMVAKQPEAVISTLKTYAYHASLAFQVKDDLLDLTGDATITGKTANLDAKNQKPNYVTALGLEATEAKLADHVVKAKAALNELPGSVNAQRYIELVDFVANRTH